MCTCSVADKTSTKQVVTQCSEDKSALTTKSDGVYRYSDWVISVYTCCIKDKTSDRLSVNTCSETKSVQRLTVLCVS